MSWCRSESCHIGSLIERRKQEGMLQYACFDMLATCFIVVRYHGREQCTLHAIDAPTYWQLHHKGNFDLLTSPKAAFLGSLFFGLLQDVDTIVGSLLAFRCSRVISHVICWQVQQVC